MPGVGAGRQGYRLIHPADSRAGRGVGVGLSIAALFPSVMHTTGWPLFCGLVDSLGLF